MVEYYVYIIINSTIYIYIYTDYKVVDHYFFFQMYIQHEAFSSTRHVYIDYYYCRFQQTYKEYLKFK